MKELKIRIQKEIWRLQMIDYPQPGSDDNLKSMQKELKDLIVSEKQTSV